MNDVLQALKQKYSGGRIFGLPISLGIFTTFSALAVYGYLGIFSRYGSDDYCLSAFYLLKGNFITLMVQRYMMASSRYTNILFIGLVDKLFGWYNVAILPALMLALFVLGLYLLLDQISQIAALDWRWNLSLLLAGLIVYFSVLQAPNLYETLYWRAGMTSHFAPLVFLTFFGAFLLRQIRLSAAPSIWVQLVCFVSAFILGGFSEPPVAIMVTVLVLGIFMALLQKEASHRRSALIVLAWALAGSLLALITLALAPANGIRLREGTPGLFDLISRTFIYPYDFIVNTVRSFPVPTLISILLPGLLFHLEYTHFFPPLQRKSVFRLGILFVIVTLLGYLLIAASFAPSVYGQSYPVARARFAGRVILTGMFTIYGVILGVASTNARIRLPGLASLDGVVLIGLMLLLLYPLRTGLRAAADIPVYQQRAALWDQRDAQMRAMQAAGQTDLVVPFLRTEVTQDLGDQTDFRLNLCASRIYGVHSIVALSPKKMSP